MSLQEPIRSHPHVISAHPWCLEKRDWTYSKWAEVIFSDESNYKLINRKSRPTVRRFIHEKYLPNMIMPRKQGGGGSVGIWGCIGELGTGCCTIYTGRMNAKNYLGVLENHFKPSIELLQRPGEKVIFQQDGATCHTAKTVKRWLRKEGVELLEWPANSPDLNPIEHIWVEIDKKLAINQPNSMAELEEALQRYWCEITRQQVLSYIESMPERVEAVIKAKGGPTKY